MNEKLLNFYKSTNEKYPLIGYILRRIYYKKLFNTVKKKIRGKGNSVHYQKSILSSVIFDIRGNNNKIDIGELCYLNNVHFFLRGDNHLIRIGAGVRFNNGGSLWIEDTNGLIQIGENSTFEDVHLAVTESESQLRIGNDCMFSYDIDVRTGDSHSIIDQNTHTRLNYAKNIFIGDHVWIGAHCSILKGVTIPNNCIVATRSVVTKKFNESNTIIAGIPGKVIKREIDWSRERI